MFFPALLAKLGMFHPHNTITLPALIAVTHERKRKALATFSTCPHFIYSLVNIHAANVSS